MYRNRVPFRPFYTPNIITSIAKGYEAAKRFFSDRLPYRVKQFVEQNANKRIESISLYRQPITSVIKKLISILSFGRWDKAQNRIGYDDLYHLFMVVQFNDDSKAIIEKNQDINVSDDILGKAQAHKAGPQGQRALGDDLGQGMSVDMKGKQPTLLELLENTKKSMGGERFYSYNFRTNNCQDFLLAVLRANGLDTSATTAFIKQQVEQLVKTLPPDVSRLATAGTTGASYVNRFLQAIGMKGFEEGGIVV